MEIATISQNKRDKTMPIKWQKCKKKKKKKKNKKIYQKKKIISTEEYCNSKIRAWLTFMVKQVYISLQK